MPTFFINKTPYLVTKVKAVLFQWCFVKMQLYRFMISWVILQVQNHRIWVTARNPYANIYRTKDNRSNHWNITGNVYAEVDFLKHLTIRTSFGGMYE